MFSRKYFLHPPALLLEECPTAPPEKYLFCCPPPSLRNTLKFRKRRDIVGKSRQMLRLSYTTLAGIDMSMQSTQIIEIIGEQLSAVSFVIDYVEFHFDGPVLRVFTNPTISTTEGQFRFPDAGSRDALCTAIQDIVRDVEIHEHDQVILNFVSGRKITVPIQQDGYTMGEAFTFQMQLCDSPLEVWNAE